MVNRTIRVMSPATATVSTRVKPLSLCRSDFTVLALFFILLISPAFAQEESVTAIEFLTEPTTLEVSKLNRYEGVYDFVGYSNSGQIQIPFKVSQQSENWTFRVRAPQFSKDESSWPQKTFDANGKTDIITASQYPKDGTVTLDLTLWQQFQTDFLRQPVRTLLAWLSIPALLLFSGILLLTRKIWLPHWRKWFGAESGAHQTTYGDYTIHGQLGKGAMGVVYLAQGQSGVQFALKSVLPEYAEDPEFEKRFEHEIRACVDLDHPNLLRYYGHGIDSNGVPFSVTELLKGATLKDKIASGLEDPPRMASDVLENIGSALDYLHQRGLIHRDIKPENIYVCEDGSLKLMDLGLVKGETMTVLTKTGYILGTPAYMSPEQFDNQTGPASDQYSLGVILYEILAGRRPFIQPDLFALAYQHKSAQPEPPSKIEPRIPTDVEETILKMVAKRPTDRFESIRHAIEACSDKLLYLKWSDPE
jgi:protein kinase-like protein